MSKLIKTSNFLPEPATTGSVMPCRHGFDPNHQYGSGLTLTARCAR